MKEDQEKRKGPLSRRDIAESAGVSERTVDRWIAKGLLRARRLGGSIRIDEKDYERFRTNAVVGTHMSRAV